MESFFFCHQKAKPFTFLLVHGLVFIVPHWVSLYSGDTEVLTVDTQYLHDMPTTSCSLCRTIILHIMPALLDIELVLGTSSCICAVNTCNLRVLFRVLKWVCHALKWVCLALKWVCLRSSRPQKGLQYKTHSLRQCVLTAGSTAGMS